MHSLICEDRGEGKGEKREVRETRPWHRAKNHHFSQKKLELSNMADV